MHGVERVGVSKAPWLATDLVVWCAPPGTHGVSPALLVPISSGSSWPWLITLLGFARPTPAWPWGNGENQSSAPPELLGKPWCALAPAHIEFYTTF